MSEAYVDKLKQHRFLGKNFIGEPRLFRPIGCYYHGGAFSVEFQVSSIGYNGRLDTEVIAVDIFDDGNGNLKDPRNIKTVIRRCLKDYNAFCISRATFRRKLGIMGDCF